MDPLKISPCSYNKMALKYVLPPRSFFHKLPLDPAVYSNSGLMGSTPAFNHLLKWRLRHLSTASDVFELHTFTAPDSGCEKREPHIN